MNSTEYFEQNDESEQTQTQFISKSTAHSSFYRTGCEQANQLMYRALDFVRKQPNCILPQCELSSN